jgi:type IV pilus assembly protein PilO
MAEGRGFLGAVPWWAQLLIMFVLAAGLMFLADFLLFADLRAQAEKDNAQALTIEKENKALEIVRVQLKDYKDAIDQMIQDLRSYRERIPEEVRISQTLGDLQSLAQRDIAIIREFKPGAVQPKEFYKEKPVDVKVGTTYARLGKFFEHIAGFKRIVRVSDVEIRQASPQTPNLTIEASYRLTTFYASEQDILGAADAGKDPAKNPPAAAPATPPAK